MQTLTEQLQKLKQGSIIETITNDNGTAIKFADGTMICMKNITLSNVPITTKIGEVYQSEIQNLGNWAENFVEVPYIAQATVNGNWASWLYQHSNWNATNAGTATLMRPTSTTASTNARYRIGITAIGRWK